MHGRCHLLKAEKYWRLNLLTKALENRTGFFKKKKKNLCCSFIACVIFIVFETIETGLLLIFTLYFAHFTQVYMFTKMEQPFYHDESFIPAYGHPDTSLHEFKLHKQHMSLTAAEPYRSLKSQLRAEADFFQPANQDVGSLKLASPELERLIIQNSHGVITTTPTPGQYFYNCGITEEQEGFADGFVKALDELHKMNHIPPPNVSIGAGGVTTCTAAASGFGSSLPAEPPVYTTLNAYASNTNLTSGSDYPTATISYLPQQQAATAHHFQHPLTGAGLHTQRLVAPKEEPQTVPDMQSSDSSPPVSPINMENQERIKAERKRQRNRLAATKCRRRKLERIARLEDKVKILKTDNAGLSNTASVLREQVAQLKQKVMTHVNSGCQLMLTSKMDTF